MSKINSLMEKFAAKKAESRSRAGSGISEKIRAHLQAEKTSGVPITEITAEMLGVEDFGIGPVYKIIKGLGLNSKDNLVAEVSDPIKHRASSILVKF
jgi:hypothetical protein